MEEMKEEVDDHEMGNSDELESMELSSNSSESGSNSQASSSGGGSMVEDGPDQEMNDDKGEISG